MDLDRRIKEYSKGNKQKLGIMLAFMSDPELVILDEPTSGLDPLLQSEFYDFMAEQVDLGRTIFFSSHVLSEAERVCDRVGIISAGKIVAVEQVAGLKEKMGQIVKVYLDGEFDPDDFIMEGVPEAVSKNGHLELHLMGNYQAVLARLRSLSFESVS